MLNLPILRWGQPYTSLEQDTVAHFITGETLAKVSQANTGLLGRDMRQAHRAREVLTAIPIADLIEMMKKAGDLYLNAALPMGDGEQSPDDFARQQSASTGLPEHMCKANMKKNHFVLSNMDQILDALTRPGRWSACPVAPGAGTHPRRRRGRGATGSRRHDGSS